MRQLALVLMLHPLALFCLQAAPVYRFPDAELMSTALTAQSWGSGSILSRQDLAGAGVRFRLKLGSAADSGKTAIGDDWPVAATANLGWDGGYLPNDPTAPHAQPHSNVDISAWGRIALPVSYPGRTGVVRMRLFMNTGMTGPSGYPSNDACNNTAWLSPLTTIRAGQHALLVLDFDNADVRDADDNPAPHSGAGEEWPDGSQHAVNERDRREITNLGFEVYGIADSTVTLDIGLPTPTPTFNIAPPQPASNAIMHLHAEDARDYRIEWSTNLLQWTALTVAPAVTNTVSVTDTNTSRHTHCYYRAVADD